MNYKPTAGMMVASLSRNDRSMHPSAPSPDQQTAQLKKQIRLFKALQYIMPGLMLVFAVVLPRTMTQVSPDILNTMIFLLCIFAVLDFGLIRFVLLPIAEKRLAELQDGNTGL